MAMKLHNRIRMTIRTKYWIVKLYLFIKVENHKETIETRYGANYKYVLLDLNSIL